MTDTQSPSRDPDLKLLLPWYVNGTLSEEEHRRVEVYLETSPDARSEVAFLRALRRQVKEERADTTPGELGPGELGLKRIQRRIAQEHRSARPSAAWWRPAAIAAALVILVQSAVLIETWQGVGTVMPAGGERRAGAVLQVTFAPDATEQEIREILQAIEGSLDGGPGALGVYRIRLGEVEPGDTASIERALRTLRGRSDIVTHADSMR